MKKNRISVLDDPKAYHQQVRMPLVQVTGLSTSELEIALAYELEPSSGIPAAEAELAFRPVEDPDATVRVYDVAVRRRRAKTASSRNLARYVVPAILFACMVIGAIAVDFVLLYREKSRLTSEIAVREPLQRELDGLRLAARQAQDEAVRIRAAREAAVKAQNDAANLRAAYPEILAEIGAAFSDKAIIRAIVADGDSFSFKVRAVALSAECASEVQTALTSRAAAHGWKFQMGTLAANSKGTNVEFEFGLKHD